MRAGSTKGAVAIRKNNVYNAYGPKVVCWTELPLDAALNSRFIIVPLQETDRTNLRRPTDPRILAHADEVRQMLQQYRLENLHGLRLGPIPGDELLDSRSRDIYESLALPIDDASIRNFLVMQLQGQQEINREPLSPVQIALLNALDAYVHAHPTDATCSNNSLTQVANLNLGASHELSRATPHEVGRVLTTFGLTERKRTNAGYVLYIGRDVRKKIHELVRHYQVEINDSVNRECCEFCPGRKTPPNGANRSNPSARTTPSSDGQEGKQSEHRELRALEKG
jgi:hypothetical protein